jgi:hypothetical protein
VVETLNYNCIRDIAPFADLRRREIGPRINVAMRSVEELPSERHIVSLVSRDRIGLLSAVP